MFFLENSIESHEGLETVASVTCFDNTFSVSEALAAELFHGTLATGMGCRRHVAGQVSQAKIVEVIHIHIYIYRYRYIHIIVTG